MNVFSKSFKESLNEVEKKVSATFFLGGKTEQSLIISMLKGARIVICPTTYEAYTLKQNLESLNNVCIMFPEIPQMLSENDEESLNNLIFALNKIIEVKDIVVLFTPNSLCGRVINKELIKKANLKLEVDKQYEIGQIVEQLTIMNYLRVEAVDEPKQFSLKGDTLTVWNNESKNIYRLSFFGDTLEDISQIEEGSFTKLNNINSLKFIGGAIDYTLSGSDIERLERNYDLMSFSKDAKVAYHKLWNSLKKKCENKKLSTFLFPFIDGFNEKISSYFNEAKVFIIDPRKVSEVAGEVQKANQSSFKIFLENGLITNAHKKLFSPDIMQFLDNKNYSYISFQSVLSSNVFFKSTNFVSLEVTHQTNALLSSNALISEIVKRVSEGFKVFCVISGGFNAESLVNILESRKLTSLIIKSVNEDFSENVGILFGSITSTVIFEEEKIALFGIKTTSNTEIKKGISEKPSFKEGDYVVHSFHGIGKFDGIVKRIIYGAEKDFIALSYAGGSKLFVPVENCDSLSRFSGGGNPRLNILGGSDFEKIKARVRESVKEIAFNLAKLYADRGVKKGFKFNKDDELQQEFENGFAFTETPTQLTAIADVKKDMESDKIMDRLICGDVGFGKTEVAMRAAFKAVVSGKQVCVLCPTTILALQHFQTFKKRMDDFGINVVLLCRFVSGKQEKENIENIENGKANIIIGTHRVLSADVKFFDLGLFIVDEEQRFGTGQKEKIKNIKASVDALALSATPIPRTLHLSLINVRDISIIDTPPPSRLPVQVYVCSYSLPLIISAVEKEMSRGGQVLVVYNNVEKVEQFTMQLRNNLSSDITVDYGHAKLSPQVLENKIFKVYNNETQVFVSTTIIENGVDLKNANTLVVIDANRFGLSQLYQLKGRVGRSDREAYAYFLTNPNGVTGIDAEKRLDAITEFTNLGSGLEIAKKDLEIRGSGNIFGAEQSGHMDKIGYDEYVKILQEEIQIATGEKVREKKEVQIQTDIAMFVDMNYAAGTEERTKIYRELAEIKTQKELNEKFVILNNKYGSVPESIKNLGEVCLIKNLALDFDINLIILNSQRCAMILNKINFELTKELSKKIALHGFVLKFESKPIIELEKSVSMQEKIYKLKTFLT